MTDQQIKAKFSQLSTDDQKRVNREKQMIKSCGANHFWVETGCYAEEPSSAWLLIAFAMMNLRFMKSNEFYGVFQ
jgi:hypothetical protein